jgi:hypothetical protein
MGDLGTSVVETKYLFGGSVFDTMFRHVSETESTH